MERGGLAGEDEDAGADNGSDAQGDQVDWAQGAAEGIFAYFVRLFREGRERLGSQESSHRSG